MIMMMIIIILSDYHFQFIWRYIFICYPYFMV